MTACCKFYEKWYRSQISLGGHLENWWSYWNHLSNRIVLVSRIVRKFMRKNIYLIPGIIYFTACRHLTAKLYYMVGEGGHLGSRPPYWHDQYIQIVFITLTVHLVCSNYKICYQNKLFQSPAVFLKQDTFPLLFCLNVCVCLCVCVCVGGGGGGGGGIIISSFLVSLDEGQQIPITALVSAMVFKRKIVEHIFRILCTLIHVKVWFVNISIYLSCGSHFEIYPK